MCRGATLFTLALACMLHNASCKTRCKHAINLTNPTAACDWCCSLTALICTPNLQLVGVTFGQQHSILARVWSYIQNQKLQEQTSPYLQLDEKLAKLFGCNQLVRDALPSAVGKLLQPMEPIKVNYTIE